MRCECVWDVKSVKKLSCVLTWWWPYCHLQLIWKEVPHLWASWKKAPSPTCTNFILSVAVSFSLQTSSSLVHHGSRGRDNLWDRLVPTYLKTLKIKTKSLDLIICHPVQRSKCSRAMLLSASMWLPGVAVASASLELMNAFLSMVHYYYKIWGQRTQVCITEMFLKTHHFVV